MTKKLTVIMLSILMLFSMSLALTACGKDDEPQQPGHTHTYATDWTTDETYHWHKCTGDGCNEVKDKAEHTYTNGVCVCGKTEPTPSVVYTVTEEEWSNAFGLDKPFYFADNYKLSANNPMGENNYVVDGNKVKEESMESGTTEKYIGYFSYEDDKYYSVYQNQSGDWKKQDAQGNPLESMCEMVIEPFLDMSLFTYDEATHTYKCATMSFESAHGTSVVLNNLTVNFENKKAVKFTYDFSFHMEVTIVYGGQSVTLPEIQEHTLPLYTGSAMLGEFQLTFNCYEGGEGVVLMGDTEIDTCSWVKNGDLVTVTHSELPFVFTIDTDNKTLIPYEDKKELPITKAQFIEIFSAKSFENVTIGYYGYSEYGIINGETKIPDNEPSSVSTTIKYDDGKVIIKYPSSTTFYYNNKVYIWVSQLNKYVLFDVGDPEGQAIIQYLPQNFLASLGSFTVNDGILYDSVTYDEDLYSVKIDSSVFTFRINEGKLTSFSINTNYEFENEYSIFTASYTFSDYGETEVSLPHIHNFNLEQVEAKYLANGADCIHYATYYKSCECGAKGTETFEYEQGGYGEHKHTESKEKVEPTCHTFGYEAGEYCTDCQQYIEGHAQIAMTNEHDWDVDSAKSKSANCTEAGVKAYKCSCEGCDATKTEVGDPAKNHSVSSWTEKSKVKVVGTTKCEYTITYEGICSNCHETITKVEVEERHEFYWAVTTEPTCQANGEKAEYCLDEDCKYHTTAHATDVYKLPEGADGHNWIKDDETNYHCSNAGCNAKKVIASSTDNTLTGSNLTTVDEIQLSTASVSMDADMKTALGSSQVSISAEEKQSGQIDTSKLSNEDKQKVESAKKIFDFTLTKDSETQSDLGGYITIRIPYTLSAGEDPERISVVCIKDDGSIESFDAVYANGQITFKTNHFSIYSVVELTPAEYCAKYDCHKQEYITANPDKFNVIAPTCTLGGYTVCLHCGEIFNATDPLGHKWVTKTESTASCTQNGCEHHECSVCGINYNTYTPAIGHNYLIESEVKATCTATGSVTYKCSHCNDEYSVTTAKLNHNYSVEIVKATCTESGYTKKVCHTCGAEVHTNVENPLRHKFGNVWVKTNDGHYHVCERCGEIDEIHSHIPGAEATETTAQICTECGYIVVPALGHTCKSHLTKVDAVNADCLNNGNVEYYVCDCGKWYLDEDAEQLITDHLSVIINALGHNIENRVPVEPTCTEVGYTAGVWCSRCQKYVSGHIEIPKKGHSYTAVVTKPTCENDGYTTYTCSCGYIESGNKTKKLGHNYVDEIIAPTCTEKGYTKHTCINCGETSNINEVDALGHAWKSEYESDKDCHWHICSRCGITGETELHTPDYEKATEKHEIHCIICGYEIAPILEHKHKGLKHDAVKETCTTTGNIEYYVCECGDWFYDEECTSIIANKSSIFISPLGHDKTYYEQLNPTCTDCGYTEGYYCELCKQWISGHERLEIDPNNHSIESHKGKDATCTEIGWKAYETCSRCDYSTYEEIPALDHDYQFTSIEWTEYTAKVIFTCSHDENHIEEYDCVITSEITLAPTCKDTGIKTYTATYGEFTSTKEEVLAIDPNNHSIESHKGKDATCTEIGWKAYETCSRCDYSTYEEIPALDHDIIHHEAKDATCTEIGWKAYDTCSRCDYTTYEEIPALDHDVSREWTGDEKGHYHACSRCDARIDEQAHVPDYAEATTEHGIHCSVCGYEIAKKLEEPIEEVKYTFDVTITIEDMTLVEHIDLYPNGIAKAVGIINGEIQEKEGVWVEKDEEIIITIDNIPQVFYVNEDGKTLTQGNKPIEPSGELVYTYDDDMDGMILHYEFYDDNTMFATAKSNGQIYSTINGTWEIKDGKVVASFDGGEEIYTINGDGTLSPYHEHVYSGWSSDETYHWHMCYRCGEIIDKAEHTPDYAEATTEHGIHCSVCGYEIAKKLEEPIEEVKYTFDVTITIEDMTLVEHIDLYPNGIAKAVGIINGERQELEGVWVEKDGEVTITINNDPQVFYVNEDGKTLTQGNKPIEPTGELVYTYDDDIRGRILHYEFYDDYTMFATAKINGQIIDSINGTWEIKDGKVVVTFDGGGEEIYTINGDGTLSPYEEPTESDEQEFIKAFDPSNFENVTVYNPMGKQMFDYPNGLVYIDANTYPSFQIMLYNGNWYKKENGEWAKAQESDYIGFTYENMVGSFETYKTFDHYYKDGAWIVNMFGEMEVPFYIENDKIVYESTMSEKDTHFYDYGSTVIEVPEDLLDFIEKQGEEPEKEVQYTFTDTYEDGEIIVETIELFNDETVVLTDKIQSSGEIVGQMTGIWEQNKDGTISVYIDELCGLLFEVNPDGQTLKSIEQEKEVQYTANFYWHELDFAVKFYTNYTFDLEVQRDGEEIFSGGADWEYVDDKVCAYFNGDPLFFEIKGDELIFIDPEGDKEFVRYEYSLYPNKGELAFYLGSTRNDVVEVIKNTQFHYVKHGITKNDEWWTVEEKLVTLSENNIGDISRINFNTIDSGEFPIIYEGISFNIYAKIIPDLRNATIVETFIYETIKYYSDDEPVWGERYITLYDNGYASYHYKNEDNYSYCAYEKATNGNDELVKIVSYGQGTYLKKTPETKDGYHFYVDYKHGEKEYTEYRLYIVGSGLEIKLYVFDDKFCEYYSNEPEDIENFRYEGTIDIVLSEDKTEITFMGSTYTIDENNMLIITLPDKVPEFDIIYMGVVNFKLYDDGSMFYVMDGVVVMQGLWSTIDEKTICISLAEGNITFYKWKVDGNWYGEEEPDFENAEVIKCKKQGEDTQYTLYLFSGWDAYLNDGTAFIDCNYNENINIITIYGLYSEYYYLSNGILSPAMYYDVRSTSGVHGSAYLVGSLSVAVINLGSLTDYDMAELSYSLNGNEITFTIGEMTVTCAIEGKTIIYNDGTPSDGREEYEILEYVFYVSKEGEKSEIILEVINQFIDKNCEFLQEFIENYDKIKDDIKMPDLSDNKSGILTVLTNATYEPFEYYENGEIVGVDVFIMTNIAEALDMQIEWTDLDFDMLLSELQLSENAVVASAISYDEYRLQYGYASKPYYTEKHIVE